MADLLLCNHWLEAVPPSRPATAFELIEGLACFIEPAPIRHDAPMCADFSRPADHG